MIVRDEIWGANPAQALRNQSGKFKVILPNGYVFQVTCRKGRNIRIREMGQSGRNVFSEFPTWQIEKIA
jgi:hypothetical protein